MARIIQPDVFQHRGPLTDRLRRELDCRGGWDTDPGPLGRLGCEPQGGGAAGAVASVTPGTGRDQGLRRVTAGEASLEPLE